MKTFAISGTKREATGKKSTRTARNEGNVPCVIYGGKETIQFTTPEKSFKKLVYTPDVHLVKIDVGGKQVDAILKDIQFHPVNDSIMHVDFLEVMNDKPVVMDIPIKFNGTAVGVKEGGKMLKKMSKVRVKGLISKIPGVIEVNVEPLKIGGMVKIKDLKYEGVAFMHQPSVTLVAVKTTRNVEETPVAGAAAAPAAAAAAAPAADAKAAAPAKEEKKEEKKK